MLTDYYHLIGRSNDFYNDSNSHVPNHVGSDEQVFDHFENGTAFGFDNEEPTEWHRANA